MATNGKNGKKTGRPKKILTPEQREELSKLAGFGLTQDQIADFFGMTDRTLRRRLKDDPGVMSAYKKGQATALAAVAGQAYKFASAGHPTWGIFWLKTQAGWRETERHEHTGADGAPIQVEDVSAIRRRILGRIDGIASRIGTQEAHNGADTN